MSRPVSDLDDDEFTEAIASGNAEGGYPLGDVFDELSFAPAFIFDDDRKAVAVVAVYPPAEQGAQPIAMLSAPIAQKAIVRLSSYIGVAMTEAIAWNNAIEAGASVEEATDQTRAWGRALHADLSAAEVASADIEREEIAKAVDAVAEKVSRQQRRATERSRDRAHRPRPRR